MDSGKEARGRKQCNSHLGKVADRLRACRAISPWHVAEGLFLCLAGGALGEKTYGVAQVP